MSWKSELKEELKELIPEYSIRDWGGYGAEPINMKSYDWALKAIDVLPDDIPKPEVGIDPNGILI